MNRHAAVFFFFLQAEAGIRVLVRSRGLGVVYKRQPSPPPASPPTLFWEGYTYRYYAATDSYAGTRDGVVYYLVPALSPEITPLGSMAEWLAVAESNGY